MPTTRRSTVAARLPEWTTMPSVSPRALITSWVGGSKIVSSLMRKSWNSFGLLYLSSAALTFRYANDDRNRVHPDIFVSPQSHCYLSVFIEADLLMQTHVQRTVTGCFAVLRQQTQDRSVRRFLSPATLQTLVVSLALSYSSTMAMHCWLGSRHILVITIIIIIISSTNTAKNYVKIYEMLTRTRLTEVARKP